MLKINIATSYNPKIFLVKLFTIFVIIFVASLSFYQVAHGAVGGSGNPGGGGGGASTRNGYGWYEFPTDGSVAPAGMKTGSWSSAKSQCSAEGANKIMAFIILSVRNGPATSGYVYNYLNIYATPYSTGSNSDAYKGDNGYPWITNAGAKARFDAIGYSGGLTWGRDIAWFCFNTDKAPSGSLSGVDCTPKVWGWAKDDDYSGNIDVHIYVNGPAGSSGASGYNIGAADIGNHTFSYTLDPKYIDNKAHSVYAYAIGVDSSGVKNGINPLLSGSPKTIGPCFDYSLTPNISINPDSVIEPLSSIAVTPSIVNSGETSSKSTEWEVTKIVVDQGKAVPNENGGVSTVPPCGNYFSSTDSQCSNLFKGNSVFNTSGGVVSGSNINTRNDSISDLPVGTKICYAFSVKPYDQSSSSWKHGAPVCAVVGKRPKVQVLGSDLSVRGLVDTSNVVKSGLTYGSWVEYGIFSVGSVDGLASGSALSSVPNDGISGSNSCNRSYLTFSNAVTAACSGSSPVGSFSNIASLPSIAASFATTTSTPTINAAGVSNNSNVGLFKATSPLNINATNNIPSRRWLVINAAGTDVNINGDITYSDGPYTDISQIPQVVIIANNINIRGNVKRVDAWLIASNSINTCSDKTPGVGLQLTISDCNQQLEVNGPVVSNHLYLQRTAGSGTGADSNTPAEIFNLRPDAYLWAYNQSKTTNLIRTVYTTALPPRL